MYCKASLESHKRDIVGSVQKSLIHYLLIRVVNVSTSFVWCYVLVWWLIRNESTHSGNELIPICLLLKPFEDLQVTLVLQWL